MEVVIKADSSVASRLGAAILARIVQTRKPAIIGLATGSTPLSLYGELVRRHLEEGLSFSDVTTFNLDEYCGLAPDHPASFHAFMTKHLFRHVDIAPDSIHLPDGTAFDVPAECASYEEKIRAAGGIDVQLLGVGHDGHLAFNEPGSSLASRTRIKTLTGETLRANAEPFGGQDKVPRHVITMGLGTIMEARCCLLLAFGKAKAAAVRDLVEGPVTASCPGSILQFHPNTIVLLDAEAASLLARRQYYLEAYAGKPPWQQWES